ncbi:MAG: DUF58 domain-containing protein [Candidatus Methanosuratincola petrocarbonis]
MGGRLEQGEGSFSLKMVRLRLAGSKPFATRRGSSAVCSGAFLAALAGISGDAILAAAGAATIAWSVADLALMISRLGREGARAGLGSGEVGDEAGSSLTSIAGEAVDFSVDIEVPGLGEVESFAADPPFEVVGHARVGGGYRVDLRAKPALYGDYFLKGLEVVARSRVGFFGARAALLPSRAGGEGSGRLVLAEAQPDGGTNVDGKGNGAAIESGTGAGIESRNGVGVAIGNGDRDPNEMLSVNGGAPWVARLRVYPRFYPLMLEALSLLGEGSLEGEAAAAGRRLGRGLEYAWSREYEPWDSPRFIDWKATARRGKLSVKEFFEDQGGMGAVVFFDGRAPGRISADEMARDLLSALLGLAGAGRRVALFLSRGGTCRKVEGGAGAGAEEALRAALAEVFEVAVGADPEVFALLPPAVRSSLLGAIRRAGGGTGPGRPVSEAQREVAAMARSGRVGDFVYVGCPLYGASGALGMISEFASHGARVRALLPTRPWLDAPTLEEAYEVRVSWARIVDRIAAFNHETVPAHRLASIRFAKAQEVPRIC